eukprot:jgi/Chlat1/4361/Chrsp29S04610
MASLAVAAPAASCWSKRSSRIRTRRASNRASRRSRVRCQADADGTKQRVAAARRRPFDSFSPPDAVWNFAYGANMNPKTLTGQRRIIPMQSHPASITGLELVFNHRGGVGNVQPAADPRKRVHGVLHQLSTTDWDWLRLTEFGYDASEYEEGAARWGLDVEYQSWLRSIEGVDLRDMGREYLDCPNSRLSQLSQNDSRVTTSGVAAAVQSAVDLVLPARRRR